MFSAGAYRKPRSRVLLAINKHALECATLTSRIYSWQSLFDTINAIAKSVLGEVQT